MASEKSKRKSKRKPRGKHSGRAKRRAIIDLVQRGTPVPYAHQMVGVPQSTFFTWVQRGNNPESREYHKFVIDLLRAVAQAHGTLHDVAWKLATESTTVLDYDKIRGCEYEREIPPDTGLLKWLLEKLHPSIYGKPKELSISLTGGRAVDADESMDELDAKAKRLSGVLDRFTNEGNVEYDDEADVIDVT